MIDNNIKEYLLPYMVNAAVKAGAAIMEVYNSQGDFGTALKSDMTPITDADRAAHSAIKEALGPTRIPILSEEGREMLFEERCNWEMFWLVDPLDGTVEFINRNNEFTVNIALMYESRAIAGVIYVPYLERLYFAGNRLGSHLCEGVAPDAGCALDYAHILERAISLPLEYTPREGIRIAVSRSHVTPETEEYIEKIRTTHPTAEVVKQGSSYKFCMLAEGAVDYYVRTSSTSEWDTAAGELILSEAGGVTASLGGESLAYNKEELHNPWFECVGARSRADLKH